MRNLIHNSITGCLFVGLFLLGSNIASAATRVALLNGEGSEQIANVVDLAQIALSREPELELLDRALIRRVLEEQKLSVSGVVDATQAIAVGKLLAVDLIAVVETSPGKENDNVPGLVIFDSRTGVRYWNAALPVAETDLEQASDAIVVAVRTAHRKREGRTPAFHTVGVMTVRNADLPRSQDGLCETVGLLVERGLSRSPDLAVLERRRLAHANEERALPVVEPPKELLASLTTIDLEIARAEDGRGLKGTALISNPKSQISNPKLTVTVTIPESNAALLTETLLAKLIAALHAAPAAATADPRLEARRFDAEATHHFSHKRCGDAVRAADAAVALDPTNEAYDERLSQYLVQYAEYLFSPKDHRWTKSGERAWANTKVEPAVLETILRDATRGVEISRKLARPFRAAFNNDLTLLGQRLRGLRIGSPRSIQQQIDPFLQLCRQRSIDYCAALVGKAEADQKMWDNYLRDVPTEVSLIKTFSIDTAQFTETLVPIAERWLAVTKGCQPQFATTIVVTDLNAWLTTLVAPPEWPWPVDGSEFAKQMAPQFVAMRAHSHPVVRLYGLLGQIRADVLLGREPEAAGYARFATEYRKLAETIIANPEPWDAERTRFAVYDAWRTAIWSMPGTDKSEFIRGEVTEFCNFMASRHEVHGAVPSVLSRLDGVDRALAKNLASQMLAVLDSPQLKATDAQKTQLRTSLKRIEQIQPGGTSRGLVSSEAVTPWSKATKIFDVTQFRTLSDLDGQTIVGDVFYGFCLQFDGDRSSLRLVRVPLKGGEVELLGKVEIPIPATTIMPFSNSRIARAEGSGQFQPRLVTAACADEGAIYVATKGAGIVVFPLDQQQPRRISLDEGLPTESVTSIAVLEGKLYAGVADGYLISYDLAARRCDVIASSRRKQKLSPFDDQPPFRVPFLVADPLRKRIVFVIGSGLWQLTPADGRITQIVDLTVPDAGAVGQKVNGNAIIWSSPLRADRALVSNGFQVMEIDLRQDRATMISVPDSRSFPAVPPHVIVDGWLWSGSTFSRQLLTKRENQILSSPDNGPIRFPARICLAVVGGGRQILAGDEESLWLLDLAEPVATLAKSVGLPSNPNAPGQRGSPKPNPPTANCTVRAVIVTEDQAQFDDAQCVFTRTTYSGPYVEAGETRYASRSWSNNKPQGGLISEVTVPGVSSFAISLPGYAPVAIGLKELKPNETVDLGTITLRRGFTWKLHIRNEDKSPVANAEIDAYSRFSEVPTKLISNSVGEAELPHAADEEYTLSLRAPGHQPAKGFKTKPAADRVTPLGLRRARPTSGTVIDSDGKPVAGARIVLFADSFGSVMLPDALGRLTQRGREMTTTDAAGKFVIDQLVDDFLHQVFVEHDRKVRLVVTDVVAGKSDQLWKLPPLIRLSGKVVGLGPKDQRVFTYMNCGIVNGETNLDADGKFRINDLIPGKLFLSVLGRRVEFDLSKTTDDYVLDLSATVPPRPLPETVPTPSASSSRATSSVRATFVFNDDTSSSLLQGTCWITAQTAPRVVDGKTHYGSSSGRSAAIKNGLLNQQIEPGLISLGISVPGYAPVALEPKEAKPNETLDFGTITLTRGFTWNVSVRNEANEPVPNAELAAVCRFGNVPIKLAADTEGQVRLEHAAEDEYSFTIRAPGHQPMRGIPLKAISGKTATISIRRAKPTSGRVVDENDQPVVGARILLLHDHIENFYPNARELTKTDTAGKFVLDQLVDQPFSTLRVDVAGKPRLVMMQVAGGKTDQVWKLLPSLTLSGRIEGLEFAGDRTLRYEQHCQDHNNRFSGSFFSGATQVDADGKFKIEGLLPGMIRLTGFRRYTDVDLPKSRDDFVLDLAVPDPKTTQGR